MLDRDAAVGIAGDEVVRPQVAVDSHVSGGVVQITVDDLADDTELARVECRAEHQGIEGLAAELGHRIGERSTVGVLRLQVDLSCHPVGGVGDAVLDDLDADVEPLVAVDDVVTGEALDSVAAATAEDNVRGLRGIEHDQLGITVRIEDWSPWRPQPEPGCGVPRADQDR